MSVLSTFVVACLTVPLTSGDVQFQFRNEANAVHVLEVTPKEWTKSKRRLIVFATPNGNTAEQSYGALAKEGRDWHYDIQHIGAQYRYIQSRSEDTDVALVILQPGQLSWPAFRQSVAGADQQIRRLIESLQSKFRADETYLTCHSGGGSLLWGWMNAHDELPASVSRLVWLDANTSYSDQLKHGDKLLRWLSRHDEARACVLAYDDREVEYQGKKVVGADGGTFRATERMISFFEQTQSDTHSQLADFQATSFLNGRALFLRHPNPKNIILHTALVGELNGFAFACLWHNRSDADGLLSGPRCYTQLISTDPPHDPNRPIVRRLMDVPNKMLELPPRASQAETGSAFIKRLAPLNRTDQEMAISAAILQGNVPDVARSLIPIEIQRVIEGHDHAVRLYVLQDYLAVGSNDDFVRMPMTPKVACQLADKLNCSLPTAQLCDHVFAVASIRLTPIPMTKDRESVSTFREHQQLIEKQLQNAPLDGLVVGHKKDVIFSNLLLTKPHRVAIYGWHYPSGVPIQPPYAGHVDWYTDYSHGVRLVANAATLDGQPQDYRDLLKSSSWHELLSSEGPIDASRLREYSAW